MLVLTRGEGQEIHLGRDIKIRVLRVSGGRARIGIEAPESLTISRPDTPQQSGEHPTKNKPTA